ncbi:MAG: hypothetical protein FWE04_01115 [Oscillospiraceae bacterium]|nr:hypothetical protein [Oscillospiraceae bacterium]
MKKLMVILLVLAMIFSLTACFGGNEYDCEYHISDSDNNYINDSNGEEDEIVNNAQLIWDGDWHLLEGSDELSPLLIGEWAHSGTYGCSEFFPAIDTSIAYIFNSDGSGWRPHYFFNADDRTWTPGEQTFYWTTGPLGYEPYGAEDFTAYGILLLWDEDGEPLPMHTGSFYAYNYFISHDGLLSLPARFATGETPVFRRVR